MYGGTWASGEIPREIIDFELMEHFHWSWADLEATPVYVRQYVTDLVMIKRQAELDRQEERRRG